MIRDFSDNYGTLLRIENIDKLAETVMLLLKEEVDIEEQKAMELDGIYALGFYLGDELIARNGGNWIIDEIEGYIVCLKNNTKVNALSKVQKYLKKGDPINLYTFYELVSED